jgi:arylsulfatase A-like enzyme
MLATLLLSATFASPNVLILLADDLRPDAVAALGNLGARTPALDRLVHEGTAFTRAYVAGSNQGAVCSPSRAMLLTGRHWRELPPRFVVPWKKASPDDPPLAPVMPALLGDARWRTFFTGKWHQPRETFNTSFMEGKRVFFGGMGPHYNLPMFDRRDDGVYEGRGTPEPRYTSDVFADAAIDSIVRGAESDQPWLTWVSFTAPHDPRTPPKDLARAWDASDVKLPPVAYVEHPFDNGELKVRDEKLLGWPRTAQGLRGEMADYLATIEGLDRAVGRILDAVDETGQRDDTLVIFLGDHGLGMGSHGLMGKQNLYEHSARTPLVMRGPGIPAGGRVDDLVYLHDIVPTVLDACGQPPLAGLGPALSVHGGAHRDALVLGYRNCQRALVTPRWKLIAYPKAGVLQCFDLHADPQEADNLVGDASAPVARLQSDLVKRLRAVNDPTAEAIAALEPVPAPRGTPVADLGAGGE